MSRPRYNPQAILEKYAIKSQAFNSNLEPYADIFKIAEIMQTICRVLMDHPNQNALQSIHDLIFSAVNDDEFDVSMLNILGVKAESDLTNEHLQLIVAVGELINLYRERNTLYQVTIPFYYRNRMRIMLSAALEQLIQLKKEGKDAKETKELVYNYGISISPNKKKRVIRWQQLPVQYVSYYSKDEQFANNNELMSSIEELKGPTIFFGLFYGTPNFFRFIYENLSYVDNPIFLPPFVMIREQDNKFYIEWLKYSELDYSYADEKREPLLRKIRDYEFADFMGRVEYILQEEKLPYNLSPSTRRSALSFSDEKNFHAAIKILASHNYLPILGKENKLGFLSAYHAGIETLKNISADRLANEYKTVKNREDDRLDRKLLSPKYCERMIRNLIKYQEGALTEILQVFKKYPDVLFRYHDEIIENAEQGRFICSLLKKCFDFYSSNPVKSSAAKTEIGNILQLVPEAKHMVKTAKPFFHFFRPKPLSMNVIGRQKTLPNRNVYIRSYLISPIL